MTSQLQQLAAAIRGLADEAEQPMQVLSHARQRARQLASQASTLGDDGSGVAGRLFDLQTSLNAVTESMSTLRSDAHRFANFLANSGASGLGSVANVVEANVKGWQAADPAMGYVTPPGTESGRYRDPGETSRNNLANAIGDSGAHRPCNYIDKINPNYYLTNSSTYRLNCGPCSRAAADAFQGRSTLPALGDTGGLLGNPGEYDEMWRALGIPEPRALTNAAPAPDISAEDMDVDAAAFTNLAYARIHAELAKLPPGSVAIIGVDWDQGSGALSAGMDPRDTGHWFNAGVDEYGNVWWADGQSGELGPWPPPPNSSNIWNAQLAVREPGSTSEWKGVDL